MKPTDLVKAINYLKPSAEYSFQESDYSTIKWDVLEGDAPTLEELEEALLKVQEQEAKAEADKLSKKAAAESKLEALGLTADDLRALGL